LDDERDDTIRSTRSDPPNDNMAVAHACLMAGNVYASRRKEREAEACWRRAAALNPQNAKCRELLGKALVAEGRAEEALVVLEELQALQPENLEVLLVLASLYKPLNNAKAVEQCLQSALAVAPEHPVVLAKLAQHYLDRNQQLPQARVLAERAARLQPSGENYFLLSALCLANQDRDAAREALQAALSIEPRNPKYIESARIIGE
jgi:tetratricopeptide (TPR) repeat protein